jgi:predicted aldo/keto reductase-like oxidoreductase
MENQKFNKSRRHFIKNSVSGIAGMTLLPEVFKSNEKPRKEKKTKIIYRTLGKTNIKLPIIGMGVMNVDNPALVEAALDAGIVLLDTAHGYQRGHNEEMIGKVIKNRPRDSYVIATKVSGNNEDRKTGLFTKSTRPELFIEQFETSLKRLGLEYVDILHLHGVVRRESALFEPLLNAMVKLKKEGKTRFIGLSTHRNEPEVIKAAQESSVYDVVLTAYNFRQPHRAEMEKAVVSAANAGLGIIAMKTQAAVYWDKQRTKQINMKAALKWVLQNENIHTTIPGFTTFDQLKMDISIMEDFTLTEKEKSDLNSIKKLSDGLYCSQCGRCQTQCPAGIDIPTLMRAYMYAYGYRNLSLAKDTLQSLRLSHIPCANCPTCNVKCSMGFNIRERILDITRLQNIPEDFLV